MIRFEIRFERKQPIRRYLIKPLEQEIVDWSSSSPSGCCVTYKAPEITSSAPAYSILFQCLLSAYNPFCVRYIAMYCILCSLECDHKMQLGVRCSITVAGHHRCFCSNSVTVVDILCLQFLFNFRPIVLCRGHVNWSGWDQYRPK